MNGKEREELIRIGNELAEQLEEAEFMVQAKNGAPVEGGVFELVLDDFEKRIRLLASLVVRFGGNLPEPGVFIGRAEDEPWEDYRARFIEYVRALREEWERVKEAA